jgi:hypothetical protein
MRILRLLTVALLFTLAACIPAQAQVTQNTVFDVSAVGPHYLIKGVAAGSGTSFLWTFKVAASQAIYFDLHFTGTAFTGPITINTSAVLDPLNYPGGNQHVGGTLTSLPCLYGVSAATVPLAATNFTTSTISAPGDIIVACSQVGATDYIVNFTTGGSTGAVIDLEEATSFVALSPVVTIPAASLAADPCLSAGTSKVTTQIAVSTSGNFQIVAAVAGKVIYPCGFLMDYPSFAGTAAETAQFNYGTGTNCGTGNGLLTGQFGAGVSNSASAVVLSYVGNGTIWNVPVSNALCLNTEGTGTVFQGAGFLTYVQQ